MEISLKLLKIQNEWWDTDSLNFDPVVLAYENSPLRFRPKAFDEIGFEPGKAVLMEGPRGVGKTTIMKMSINELITDKGIDPKDIFYYSCQNISSKEQLNELLKTFLYWRRTGGTKQALYIFLDEVTQVHDWQVGLNHLCEAGLLDNIFLFISSSVLSDQSGKIGDMELSDVRLSSVSFREFVAFMDNEVHDALAAGQENFSKHQKKMEYLLDIYLLTGGYISAMNSFVRNGQVNQEIYDSYLNWMVADVARQGRDLVLFRQIIEQVIDFQGMPLGYKTLGKKTKAQTHNTVTDYIRMLQSMFVVQALYQCDEEGKINKSSNKKIFFRDIFSFWVFSAYTYGSLNYWKFSREYIHEQFLFPALLENLVFSHLLRGEKKDTWEESMTFWRDIRKKGEISFVVAKGNARLPIIVRQKMMTDDTEMFKRAGFESGLIISNDLYGKENSDIMPLLHFLFYN